MDLIGLSYHSVCSAHNERMLGSKPLPDQDDFSSTYCIHLYFHSIISFLSDFMCITAACMTYPVVQRDTLKAVVKSSITFPR